MKKLTYLFLALIIFACSSDDSTNNNNSIVGNWQISDNPDDFLSNSISETMSYDEYVSFLTESVGEGNSYECFIQTRYEFFDDLNGPLQEGWYYYAYLNGVNGPCIVADEDDSESILLKWENTTDNNYRIYLKYVDFNELAAYAIVNGNTLELRDLEDTPRLILSRL
jgi:hypothetical protein